MELELPAFAQCAHCKEWFPIEKLVMLSVYGLEPKLSCVHCLLYFLGEVLREERVAS
jgi:hypothetical protein